MEPRECGIARLPEELVSAVLSRTSPRDACRAAAVSVAFRAAADSNAVWDYFLPLLADLPPLADGELTPPRRKKDLFLRLLGSHVLLPGERVSMWLDRETGARCYMVSARELSIAWGNWRCYWSWITLPEWRFFESALLECVSWLEIRGKIHSGLLSRGFAYAAYMVYNLTDESYGLDSPAQDASVTIGGTDLARKVCLHPNPQTSHAEDVALPRERADGWLELELGEFVYEGDEDGDVSFGLAEIECLNVKSGLMVQGIEIRRKKSG